MFLFLDKSKSAFIYMTAKTRNQAFVFYQNMSAVNIPQKYRKTEEKKQ